MINNSNTPKLDKDIFRFVVPADLEKAADGSYKIRGLASTEKVDQQGEVIIQKGVDLTPIDKKKGILNWDHQKGPENTIGILDGYQRTQKGLFIEGRLFKNHTKAKAVREIMESLGEGDRGRMGLSVEGRILERDPLNPSVIRKCQINAVALTMNPVNVETYADIAKSMNAAEILEIDAQEEASIANSKDEPIFTTNQVMAIVQKALSVGAGSTGVPDAKTGGAALQPSDMKGEKLEKCSKCGEVKCECAKKSEDVESDLEKGGPGSGVKGHVTAKKYSWGTMRRIDSHDNSHSVPIHPEHWDEMKAVHHGKKESGSFKDETGKNWKVSRHEEGGVELNHESMAGKWKHHVTKDQMEASDPEVEKDPATGLPKHGHGGPISMNEKQRKEKKQAAAKKRRMKWMSKSLYKSNLIMVLDKLQVLYPNHSRTEIWEAVKERLETKFEIVKGGPGSGVSGHKTVRPIDSHLSDYKSKNAHLSREQHRAKAKELRSADGSPRYKENMAELASYHEHEASVGMKKSGEVESDLEKGGPGSGVKGHRTAKKPSVHRPRKPGESIPNYIASQLEDHGVKVHAVHHSARPDEEDHAIHVGDGVHVQVPAMGDNYMHVVKEHPDGTFTFHEERLSVPEIVADIERAKSGKVKKGLRLKNMSGKEREHKLYEDARQRDDYERNKDKSRVELNQLAEESGASKHDKAKIRAQHDAAIQVGERDHVRPNVKG